MVANYNPFFNDEYQLGIILLLMVNKQIDLDLDVMQQIEQIIDSETNNYLGDKPLIYSIIYKLLTQNNLETENELFGNIDNITNLDECLQLTRDYFETFDKLVNQEIVNDIEQQKMEKQQQEMYQGMNQYDQFGGFNQYDQFGAMNVQNNQLQSVYQPINDPYSFNQPI